MKTTIQEVYFDLCDLMDDNPNLMSVRIEGFDEFRTLGEFIAEQKVKMSQLEDSIEE